MTHWSQLVSSRGDSPSCLDDRCARKVAGLGCLVIIERWIETGYFVVLRASMVVSENDMTRLPVILFDVMDTLVYNPFREEIPKFFGMSTGELARQKDPTAWPDFELGRIDESQYFHRYFRDRRAFDHQRLIQVIADAYRWLDGAEQVLSKLRDESFQMHAFSNYPAWYQTIEDRLGLSNYVRWTFVSCLTGARKPAAAAYQYVLETLGTSPDSCLLIDDRDDNCVAAVAQGMQAIRFQDMSQLSEELQRRGIMPSS